MKIVISTFSLLIQLRNVKAFKYIIADDGTRMASWEMAPVGDILIHLNRFPPCALRLFEHIPS